MGVHRRELLAGTAALGVAGVGAAVTVGGWNPLEDGAALAEFELESLEAPGSEAGTVVVPERGSVTVLELFATWCGVCERLMEPMGAVYDDLGERGYEGVSQGGDVQFLSVTNEPLGRTTTRADVASWWEAHDGRWTVASDADLELTGALDATAVPYTVVLDEANVVTWSETGYKSVEELREPIFAALGE
ncbi:TlpA disulfide reductase family protein [Natronoglomus mannanivorans]|uniref:TlpA family protein disulfide reductase n=1 Tax=Natronoglomus mannanivorans TaxID=2979990 RepID=UPI003083C3E8